MYRYQNHSTISTIKNIHITLVPRSFELQDNFNDWIVSFTKFQAPSNDLRLLHIRYTHQANNTQETIGNKRLVNTRVYNTISWAAIHNVNELHTLCRLQLSSGKNFCLIESHTDKNNSVCSTQSPKRRNVFRLNIISHNQYKPHLIVTRHTP